MLEPVSFSNKQSSYRALSRVVLFTSINKEMALLKACCHRVRKSIASITILFPRYFRNREVTRWWDEMVYVPC